MIERLHYITQEVTGKSHTFLAELACKGGCRWVQLRVKDKAEGEVKPIALEVQRICKHYGATFIINDHVKLAAELKADGVHLGKTDMAVDGARKILGPKAIIGGTANDMHDIENLRNTSVSYIGLGPFRFTSTKKNLSPILGAEGIKALLQDAGTLNIPVIAIGGIQTTDVARLMKTGVYGIAVSSAMNMSRDPVQTARDFMNSLKQKRSFIA